MSRNFDPNAIGAMWEQNAALIDQLVQELAETPVGTTKSAPITVEVRKNSLPCVLSGVLTLVRSTVPVPDNNATNIRLSLQANINGQPVEILAAIARNTRYYHGTYAGDRPWDSMEVSYWTIVNDGYAALAEEWAVLLRDVVNRPGKVMPPNPEYQWLDE